MGLFYIKSIISLIWFYKIIFRKGEEKRDAKEKSQFRRLVFQLNYFLFSIYFFNCFIEVIL